jgi:hypothetical protein
MKYNLSSSMSDRINYDEMVQRYAEQCLNALTTEEQLALEPADYAQTMFDMDVATGTNAETDDPAEAEGRFLSVFGQAVVERQKELQQQALEQGALAEAEENALPAAKWDPEDIDESEERRYDEATKRRQTR